MPTFYNISKKGVHVQFQFVILPCTSAGSLDPMECARKLPALPVKAVSQYPRDTVGVWEGTTTDNVVFLDGAPDGSANGHKSVRFRAGGGGGKLETRIFHHVRATI